MYKLKWDNHRKHKRQEEIHADRRTLKPNTSDTDTVLHVILAKGHPLTIT